MRKDDKELLAGLDAALDKAKPKIEEILKDEGIPLVTGLAPLLSGRNSGEWELKVWTRIHR